MKEKEAADRIIAHVYEHVGEFSARLIAPVSPKQFAAAGLMRCCRLLNGIFVLYGARMPELAGILARQLWEAWVVSLYVLLDKDEAMKVIDGDDFYWKSRIVDYLGVEDDYYHLESAKRSEKLIYKKVSDRVLELLREREEGGKDGPVALDAPVANGLLPLRFRRHTHEREEGLSVAGPELVHVQLAASVHELLEPP